MNNIIRAALVFTISACAVAATPLPGYELSRRTRKNKASQPLIFGCIDQPGRLPVDPRRPVQAAVIAVDGLVTYADATGCYSRPLQPGAHQVLAGFIGFLPIRLKHLQLQQGDSVRLDFHLQQDKRPTTN